MREGRCIVLVPEYVNAKCIDDIDRYDLKGTYSIEDFCLASKELAKRYNSKDYKLLEVKCKVFETGEEYEEHARKGMW